MVHIGDMNLPLAGLTKKDKHPMKDITELPLRPDDVMLLSYPKTGIIIKQIQSIDLTAYTQTSHI